MDTTRTDQKCSKAVMIPIEGTLIFFVPFVFFVDDAELQSIVKYQP